MVETVDHFKYLGVTLDNQLTFDQHISDIHQRLSVIHKLKGLYVAPHLLLLLYQSMIQSIILYCSICFFGMLSVKNKAKLIRITKIIGLPASNLTELNNRAIINMATSIEQDITHTESVPHPTAFRMEI